MRTGHIIAATAVAAIAAGAGQAAAADSVGDFYKVKDIKLVVGSSAGGGYDTYARTIARHMGNYIPGKPALIVQNMPGASSLKAANFLYNVAPKDGSTIASVFSGIPTEPLINPTLAKFNAAKFNWIGSANKGVQVGVVWHTAPVQTLKQAMTQTMLLGSSGGATHDFPALAKAILGVKFKLIEGYSGTKEIGLAMERGEVMGDGGITWSSLKSQHSDWLKSGKVHVFVQYGREPHPDLPDVPLMVSLARSKADRQALHLGFVRQQFARPYVAPPDIPADRLEALRTAFDKTMKDPGFLADAKRVRLEIDPLTGKEVAALIAEIYQTPEPVIERVRKILAVKKGGK